MPFAAGIPVTRTNMAKAITSFGWMINARKPKLPFSQKQNLESNWFNGKKKKNFSSLVKVDEVVYFELNFSSVRAD